MTTFVPIDDVVVGREKVAQSAGNRGIETITESVRFAYRPMWSPAHGVISTYLCVPLVPTSDIGTLYGEAAPMLGSNFDEIGRLDFAVLRHVLTELRTMVQEGRHLLVTMPVHFETLSPSARRNAYAKELAAGITPETARLLVIEVIGIPDGVLQMRMVELVTPLRPYCRTMTARVRLELPDFSALKVLGILSVGCDIADNRAPELLMMQRMGRFSRVGERARMVTHIHGVRSLSLLGAALGAGFRYIDGDIVSPMVDRPRKILKFSLADAYRPLVEARPDCVPRTDRGGAPSQSDANAV